MERGTSPGVRGVKQEGRRNRRTEVMVFFRNATGDGVHRVIRERSFSPICDVSGNSCDDYRLVSRAAHMLSGEITDDVIPLATQQLREAPLDNFI